MNDAWIAPALIVSVASLVFTVYMFIVNRVDKIREAKDKKAEETERRLDECEADRADLRKEINRLQRQADDRDQQINRLLRRIDALENA